MCLGKEVPVAADRATAAAEDACGCGLRCQAASAYLLGRLAKHLGERGLVDIGDLLGEARAEMGRRFEAGDEHATAARLLVRQLEVHLGGGRLRRASPGGRFKRLARLLGKGHNGRLGFAGTSDAA